MKYLGRSSLVINILVVFILFNLTSLFVFAAYVFYQDREAAQKSTEASIKEIAFEKANVISLTLTTFSYETENLASWARYYLLESEDTPDELSEEYQRAANGILYRIQPQGGDSAGSGIFFPANVEVTEQVIHEINATAHLDPLFETFKERQPLTQWVYISTEEGLLRCAPHPSMEVFDPNHQQKTDTFYVMADAEHNPQRKTVWTRPYVDYLGTGWTISCSHPVYDKDRLLGIVSADINIETLRQKFFVDFSLGESAKIYLIENTGDIIYHPDYVTKTGAGGELYMENIFDDDKLSSGMRTVMKGLLDKGRGVVSCYDQEDGRNVTKKTLAYAPIEGQPWTLVVEINNSEYQAVNRLKTNNMITFLLSTTLALIVFAVILYRRYSRPMNDLVAQAQGVAEGDFSKTSFIEGFSEIEILSEAFCLMSDKLNTYTTRLQKKTNEIESIFNSISGVLMIIAKDGSIRTVNREGQLLIDGMQKNGRPTEKCYQIFGGRDQRCAECPLDAIAEARETGAARQKLVGDEIYRNTYYPIFGEDNKVEGVVLFAQPITENILIEKELQQSEKLAGIGQISSAVAHELKNPLAVIEGALYLLRIYTQPERDENVDETLDTISEATANAERVITSLLDFSSQSGDEDCSVDITKIINQLLILTNRDRIRDEISVVKEFSPDPLIWYGAAEPLKNILQNLINNALEAIAPGGTVKIKGSYLKRQNGVRLLLSVEDDGSGIPEEDLGKIFTPFFSRGKEEKGTGLGLWITKMLADKIGAEIHVESRVGQGTTFTVSLPVKKDLEKSK
ncbi:ATP-binding protein [Bacilliculturomica massiliensis]|uniref:ATP-binding protein n=1 Tax=Bacilliculturomica massiliensis TaxID=1917867 RepID=UPI0013EF500F|nr:ATP-binding protein [Bacilliculturomica massiliensis]